MWAWSVESSKQAVVPYRECLEPDGTKWKVFESMEPNADGRVEWTIPGEANATYIQVRAVNFLGASEWSDSLMLEPEALSGRLMSRLPSLHVMLSPRSQAKVRRMGRVLIRTFFPSSF